MAPKLFISYSWSSADHEKWVEDLAEELASKGVDVIFDKWDLQPGHDSIQFMERMVASADVKKVLIICDKMYAEKSNNRKGGAGTEAQIITPEIYASDTQDKFVAAVRERDADGKPYLPIYYGKRMYFDLQNSGTYAREFEKVLRWAHDRPEKVRPPIGEIPAFLLDDDKSVRLATGVEFRRAIEAIKAGREIAPAATGDYFRVLVREMQKFRLESNNEPDFDDRVYASIEAFTPYRNEVIELLVVVASYNPSADMIREVHRLFEQLIPFTFMAKGAHSYSEWDFDNFRFITKELLLYTVGILIKYDRFDAVADFLGSDFYIEGNGLNVATGMVDYLSIQDALPSFDYRNRRLDLRKLSPVAVLLMDRNAASGIDFRYLMSADLVLYLRSQTIPDRVMQWWPETLIYTGRQGAIFEIFARSASASYFNKIKGMLGVDGKARLAQVMDAIDAQPDYKPRWQFTRIEPRAVINFDKIGTKP